MNFLMNYRLLKNCAFLLTVLILLSSFIVIRHDKTDAEYIALAEKYPFVCKIGTNGGDGTLINDQWVITAGHVAEGMQRKYGKELKIYFQGETKGYGVEQVFIHPDFKPMGDHDIALIKLKQPVTGIKPAVLYRKRDEKGKNIVIVGHGDFKTGNEKQWRMDGKKRAATNRIDSVTSTHIIYTFDQPGSSAITELEGTAGRGDSGGPAIIQTKIGSRVAGISSAGLPGEQGPGTYGAIEHYTRVSSYLKWIDQVLSGKIKATQPSVAMSVEENDPPVLNGLGLILNQEGNRIAINGKIDQEVPPEFRNVIFGNGSFIVSLNKKTYTSLETFRKDFSALKKGMNYEIEFNVKGQLKKFEVVR